MPPRAISNQSSSSSTAVNVLKTIATSLASNTITANTLTVSNTITANTLTVSNTITARTLAVSNTLTTSNLITTNLITANAITAFGNVLIPGTSDVIINTTAVRDTLVNSAFSFPDLTIGAGTSNGNGTTHAYVDNYMAGNIFASTSSPINASWPAWAAFDKNFGGTAWMTDGTRDYSQNVIGSGSTAVRLPNANTANTAQVVLPTGGPVRVQGEWVQIQLPIAIVPAAYHVFPRSVYWNRTASRFRLVASNNVTNLAGANATVQDAKVWTQLHYANVEPQAIADGQTWKFDGRRYKLGNVTTSSFNTFRFITEAVFGFDSAALTLGELVITGFPQPVYS